MSVLSREHRKYVREERTRTDQAQACFNLDGSVKQHVPVEVASSAVNVEQIVMCPFCLAREKLQRFLVSTKKGISSSNGECPECKSGMRLRTLLRKWTPESFAEWVFEYSLNGYWQKVKFDAWKERLKQIGWTRSFWDHYNAVKVEKLQGQSDSYIDYMNRQGEETARQWNEQGEVQ